MPGKLDNAFILTCNISLEHNKPTNVTQVLIKDAEEREKFLKMERQYIDDRVAKIIELKRQVCDTEDKSFVIINENGIDPASLSMLASEGILALRRAKRINMKRCEKACGGVYINSVDDLSPKVLGFARNVNQLNLG